jgi:hypothetical protein
LVVTVKAGRSFYVSQSMGLERGIFTKKKAAQRAAYKEAREGISGKAMQDDERQACAEPLMV